MNLNGQWIENFSKRNNMYYYYNKSTNASLWKVESPEKGWARTLIDAKHPERGEKFVNIFTNKEFYSKAEYEKYIANYYNKRNDEMFENTSKTITQQSLEYLPKQSVKREREEDEFSSLVSADVASTQVNSAQQFYNKRDKTKEERLMSSVLHLRNLNNWIKLLLINTYCKEKSRVLDLACGKGGDLKKWKERSILHYVGVDIADGSIADAVRRYKGMLNAGFPARFAVGNLGKCDLSTFLESGEVFDIISCQFAMHYMFEDESWIRNFLSNISRFLKPNGYFIGTLCDSNAIVRTIRNRSHREGNEYVWKNSICCIAMDEENYDKLENVDEKPCGIGYKFTLTESVDDVPEYLATTEYIRKLCSEYHLEIVEKQNFQDFIRKMLPKHQEEFISMNVPNNNGELTEDEVEVAQLYCILVLKRIHVEEDDFRGLDDEDIVPLGKSQKEISEADIRVL